MCSKQKIRKTAFILLLVTLFSLIPCKTFSVLADDIIPPFPYDELQTIGENDYALFKVHGVEQVDYIEVLMPKIKAHGNFEHLMPGLSYSSLGGWVLQINSIDYYFKDGQSIYFDLQSLFTTSFMPIENNDNYFPAWLEFVYSSEDVWGIDEDAYNDRGLRFFKAQNFIIEPAATPTPTPEEPIPTPELDTKFPIFINAYKDNYLNSSNRSITKFLVCNRYYDETNLRYEYQIAIVFQRFTSSIHGLTPCYTPVFNGYDYSNNILTFYFPNIAESYNFTGYYSLNSFNTDNYYTDLDTYDLTNFAGVYPSNPLIETTERNYQFTIDTSSMNYESTAIYSINTDGSTTRLDGQGGGTATPTPTPTSAPTPIPQPSVTPEPDNDKPGWGWGIVNTLRYIFIPDKNKLIRLQKTADTKFKQFGGGYDDLKRVSGFEDPVRPQNVVMNWHPFGTDSVDDQQEITLVDFEQIDFYLFQTSSGMFIKDCLSASFTFLMFGYLIHVIRKHFVIENTDDDKGGGD